ncbi:MAG: membrane-bound lytic murein transglycosylase MltF [Gallionella sp.]|nr:membrane-bound lytic murein transglycosylase MltF [Gallionella sp.]
MYRSTRSLRALIAGLGLLMVSCGQSLPSWRNGELLVIVQDGAQSADAEFEREMAKLFGEYLHSTVRFIPSHPAKIDRALRRHHAHFAAASLRTEINVSSLHFGPSYQTVREQLICNRDHKPPRRLAQLGALRLAVPAGSDKEYVLKEAQESYPALAWESRPNTTVEELLREVANSELDCTVANENRFANARNHYSNLVAAFDIGSPSRLAWAFSRDVNPDLIREAQGFFRKIDADGTLNRLLERYYGHNGRLQTLDSATFVTRTNTVLPEYRALFEEAAEVTGIDWRLLAALAYQESQWDPLATSYTNVRGMMMLTEDTADRMKVKNRLDPRESIFAGAKYLLLLKDQLPDRIPEPDRTWLALAAYNQGYGHLEDARVLTTRMGMNPDSWGDVKRYMPLLNQPGYYETLKYGYARGGEAVILVESIRSYYDMLKRLEPGGDDAAPDETPTTSYRLLEPLKRWLR